MSIEIDSFKMNLIDIFVDITFACDDAFDSLEEGGGIGGEERKKLK